MEPRKGLRQLENSKSDLNIFAKMWMYIQMDQYYPSAILNSYNYQNIQAPNIAHKHVTSWGLKECHGVGLLTLLIEGLREWP